MLRRVGRSVENGRQIQAQRSTGAVEMGRRGQLRLQIHIKMGPIRVLGVSSNSRHPGLRHREGRS